MIPSIEVGKSYPNASGGTGTVTGYDNKCAGIGTPYQVEHVHSDGSRVGPIWTSAQGVANIYKDKYNLVLTKETAVSFDFDAFNRVLQGSTAICAKGKADIAKAVAAGKGEPQVKIQVGIFKSSAGFISVVRDGAGLWLALKGDSNKTVLKHGHDLAVQSYLQDNGYVFLRFFRDITG